jgi:DNA-binding LacI/PurR family transcriptional regulator
MRAARFRDCHVASGQAYWGIMAGTKQSQATRSRSLPRATTHSRDYIYRRIAAALERDIRARRFPAGARLPSADELSARYEVNKGTVRRALAELTAAGFIYAVPAQGTYVADSLPEGRRKRRAGALTIGIVSQVLEGKAFGPSDAEIIGSLQEELAKRGGNLLLLPVARAQTPAKLCEEVVRAQLDGAIYLEAFEPAALRRVLQVGPPAVMLNFRPRGHGLDSILVDNVGGAAQAIEHLHGLGHRRILVITGPDDLPATVERTQGVHEAATELGIAAGDIRIVAGDFRRLGGYKAMAAALEARTKPPTAVFCFNDEMAVGALQAIHKHSKLSVPRELSVCGFDDISWAEAANPPLTTVRVDKATMGRLAVERLLGRIEGHPATATATTVETELVMRESTAACRDEG